MVDYPIPYTKLYNQWKHILFCVITNFSPKSFPNKIIGTTVKSRRNFLFQIFSWVCSVVECLPHASGVAGSNLDRMVKFLGMIESVNIGRCGPINDPYDDEQFTW